MPNFETKRGNQFIEELKNQGLQQRGTWTFEHAEPNLKFFQMELNQDGVIDVHNADAKQSDPIKVGERNVVLFEPGTHLKDVTTLRARDKSSDRFRAKGDEVDLAFENKLGSFVLRVTPENRDGRLVEFELKNNEYDLDREVPAEEKTARSKAKALEIDQETQKQIAADRKVMERAELSFDDLAKRLFAVKALALAVKELPAVEIESGVWKAGVEFAFEGKTYRASTFLSDTKRHSPLADKLKQIDPVWFELEDLESGKTIRFNEITPSLIYRYGYLPRWQVKLENGEPVECNLDPANLEAMFAQPSLKEEELPLAA